MPRSGIVAADMEHDSVYVGLMVLRTQRALHVDLTLLLKSSYLLT